MNSREDNNSLIITFLAVLVTEKKWISKDCSVRSVSVKSLLICYEDYFRIVLPFWYIEGPAGFLYPSSISLYFLWYANVNEK